MVYNTHKTPRISTVTADAFNRSIELALRNPPDAAASAARIRRVINGLPDGTLYCSSGVKAVSFHIKINQQQKYISKKSALIYSLARKKYLLLLLEILELTGSKNKTDIRRQEKLIAKLQHLISTFERGNLDLARIVFTSKQYKWFTAWFKQKYIQDDTPHKSTCGIPVRSKSERDIANRCEALAVPYHYEEQQLIYVKPLVDRLRETLHRDGYNKGRLCTFKNGTAHWNVPAEYDWMNAPGSVWRSYYPYDGTVELFPDFRIVLADDEVILWEHEGLMDDFLYRIHAADRASVMKYTGTVSEDSLIETYELHVDTPEKIDGIIEARILPRLWF